MLLVQGRGQGLALATVAPLPPSVRRLMMLRRCWLPLRAFRAWSANLSWPNGAMAVRRPQQGLMRSLSVLRLPRRSSLKLASHSPLVVEPTLQQRPSEMQKQQHPRLPILKPK